jgi:glycosyltransferase involved in cell wall biosynthesis
LAERISVVMTVHDGELPSRLGQSLESLAAQTLAPDEVVIAADGPIGAPLQDVIDSFVGRLNICEVTNQERRGSAAAANLGLENSSNELVARLDSDDVASPWRLALQRDYFAAEPLLDILGGYAQEFSEAGPGPIRRMPGGHDRIKAALWSNPIINSSVMFRRSKIRAIGGYDETLLRGEDYELWLPKGGSGD